LNQTQTTWGWDQQRKKELKSKRGKKEKKGKKNSGTPLYHERKDRQKRSNVFQNDLYVQEKGGITTKKKTGQRTPTRPTQTLTKKGEKQKRNVGLF